MLLFWLLFTGNPSLSALEEAVLKNKDPLVLVKTAITIAGAIVTGMEELKESIDWGSMDLAELIQVGFFFVTSCFWLLWVLCWLRLRVVSHLCLLFAIPHTAPPRFTPRRRRKLSRRSLILFDRHRKSRW
jgi:hypothetical protein